MSARNDNTFIDYSAVAASANTIRECSTTMKGIFDDFENKIKQATSDGVFEGQASEAFKERYNAFKTRFDSFTTAITQASVQQISPATTSLLLPATATAVSFGL